MTRESSPPKSDGTTRRVVIASLLGASVTAWALSRRSVSSPASEPGTSAAPPPSASETPGPQIVVEVWHDTVCPWCRIGIHNLGVALDAWKGASVEMALHPFLLNPDTPKEGIDLRAHLSAKFGMAADSVFAPVSRAGAHYGVRFDWDKVRISPDSVPSHTLIAACPQPSRRALVEGIHRAYFEEGKNIGDPETLVAVARDAGLSPTDADAWIRDGARAAEVRREARAAAEAGIQGVPHFRFGPQSLQGAQSPEALREALESLATG